MKYLLSLLILFPVIANPQSVFTDDMLWSTCHGPSCGFDDSDCWSYYTKIVNDTIINEVLYKQVMNSTDALMNKWNDVGFIREDGQRIFYRRKNSDIECLLYDFSCSVGDTLNLDCSCIYESKFKVDSIKYLPVMGNTRKHIYLRYLENISTECWIEGIGSVSGILNGGGAGNCMTGFHERLLCCSKNDEIIYRNPYFETCYLATGSNMPDEYPEKNSSLMIFPNPANNEITIRTASNDRIQSVEVVSLKGKSVLKQAGIDKTECRVLTSHLPKGAYVLNVKTNHKLESDRIIIQ